MATIRPIHLALLTLVGMYTATTLVGAALFTTEFGREQLQAFMSPEPVPFDWMTTIGSPLYWALLLSLAVIPPLSAIATARIAGHFLTNRATSDIPTWIAVALAAVLVAFCIYTLAEANALTAHEMWDRTVCFAQKMERRVELIKLMGNRYYAFAYSSLPILSSFLLAKGVLQKDRLALGAFFVLSFILIWFYLAMIMKAPVVIYIGMIALTLILCDFGWVRSFSLTTPFAIATYFLLSTTQFCETNTWTITEGRKTEIKPGSSQATPGPRPLESEATSHPASSAEKAIYIARNALLRMAAAFPYYVQEFENPDARCGLEVPPLVPLLSPQKCFGPTKVFRLMYPKVTYVTGFAPAPINVSAYAEIGPVYALFAMVGCGAIIGALAFLARGRDPLSVSFGVAVCIYAYYVSQVSFTGSLFDSYGLFWLLLPIGTMAAISAISTLLIHYVRP